MTTTATVSIRIDPTEPAEVRIHTEGNQTIIVAGRVELHCDHWHDRHTPRALSEWLRDLAAQVEDVWHEHERTEDVTPDIWERAFGLMDARWVR